MKAVSHALKNNEARRWFLKFLIAFRFTLFFLLLPAFAFDVDKIYAAMSGNDNSPRLSILFFLQPVYLVLYAAFILGYRSVSLATLFSVNLYFLLYLNANSSEISLLNVAYWMWDVFLIFTLCFIPPPSR